jgi:hypothetical protein
MPISQPVACSGRQEKLSMYRPKSSSQLVIYPSKVRSIKFTVPRLIERQNADSSTKWKSEPNLDADFDEHSSSGNDVHSASSDRLSSHVCNKFNIEVFSCRRQKIKQYSSASLMINFLQFPMVPSSCF